MTTITLTDEDALKFIAFQRHYDLFTTLELTGALNTKYGKVIINFANGIPQNVVIEAIAWKR